MRLHAIVLDMSSALREVLQLKVPQSLSERVEEEEAGNCGNCFMLAKQLESCMHDKIAYLKSKKEAKGYFDTLQKYKTKLEAVAATSECSQVTCDNCAKLTGL